MESQEALEILNKAQDLGEVISFIESGYCKELTGAQITKFLIEQESFKLLEAVITSGLLGKFSQEDCERLFNFFGKVSCLQAFSIWVMSPPSSSRPPHSVYSTKDYMNLEPEQCPFCRRRNCICGILEEKPHSEHEARLDVKHGLGTCSHDL